MPGPCAPVHPCRRELRRHPALACPPPPPTSARPRAAAIVSLRFGSSRHCPLRSGGRGVLGPRASATTAAINAPAARAQPLSSSGFPAGPAPPFRVAACGTARPARPDYATGVAEMWRPLANSDPGRGHTRPHAAISLPHVYGRVCEGAADGAHDPTRESRMRQTHPGRRGRRPHRRRRRQEPRSRGLRVPPVARRRPGARRLRAPQAGARRARPRPARPRRPRGHAPPAPRERRADPHRDRAHQRERQAARARDRRRRLRHEAVQHRRAGGARARAAAPLDAARSPSACSSSGTCASIRRGAPSSATAPRCRSRRSSSTCSTSSPRGRAACSAARR